MTPLESPSIIGVKSRSELYLMAEQDWQEAESEIVVLEGLDAIRIRPNLYLEGIERADLFDDLIFESLCHAIDEVVDDRCTQINIDVASNGSICVKYDAGMPLKRFASGKMQADLMFTVLHACHNLKKHLTIGDKFCKYGLTVVNACCAELHIDIVFNGERGRQIYKKGKTDRDFIISRSHEENRTHFQLMFDEELLGKHKIHLDRLQLKAQELTNEFGVTVNIDHTSILKS
jgi:DNA gyrase/topoisomerase IV subunit B